MYLEGHTIKPGTPEHEHRRNSGTPWDSNGTTVHYPDHQRITPEYQQNTNVTPVEHPQNNGTIQNKFKQTS